MSGDVRDLRRSERFVVREALEGSLAASDVTVLNLCEEGALISHGQPMRIGTRGRFHFRLGHIHGTAQARIVWSHLTKQVTGGSLVYHSGLEFEADPGYVEVLRELVEHEVVVPDAESLEKRRQKLEDRERKKTGETPMPVLLRSAADDGPDPTLLVRHAQTHLRNNPLELQRFYLIAREAAGEAAIDGDRAELLAIWEYLERSVDVATIERALRRR